MKTGVPMPKVEPTDADIIKHLNSLIAQRTRYGMRQEKTEKPSYMMTWSNGSRSWYVARAYGVRQPGEVIDLDADSVLAPYRATTLDRVIGFLDELPLFKFSFEAGMKPLVPGAISDEEWVKRLREDGKEVWDGHYPTDFPEKLPNIHVDADTTTMKHLGGGSFEDKDRFYDRADNPYTHHRFYTVRHKEQPYSLQLREELTPEEKLKGAIKGSMPWSWEVKCAKCNKVVKEPIYVEGKPYHNLCVPRLICTGAEIKFIETRNAEGGLDRAVRFFDAQNNPLAEIFFGNVKEEGIVIQEVKALGQRLSREDFRKIIGSIEELASQQKRPVVWVQSRAKDKLIYEGSGYTFDQVTGTYVKNVLGGKVPAVKFEDVMFQIRGGGNPGTEVSMDRGNPDDKGKYVRIKSGVHSGSIVERESWEKEKADYIRRGETPPEVEYLSSNPGTEVGMTEYSKDLIARADERYSLAELTHIAGAKGVTPSGDKETLIRRLFDAGVMLTDDEYLKIRIPSWLKEVGMDELQAKAIAEEAAVKASELTGQKIAMQVAKELSGEVLHSSPISPHCQAVLGKPPECTDFRGIRSWVLCKAFALLEEGGRKKLPVGEAWAEARKVCQR